LIKRCKAPACDSAAFAEILDPRSRIGLMRLSGIADLGGCVLPKQDAR
jgi:hypothetical protein